MGILKDVTELGILKDVWSEISGPGQEQEEKSHNFMFFEYIYTSVDLSI